MPAPPPRPRSRRPGWTIVLGALLAPIVLTAATGCRSTSSSPAAGAARGTLTVSAAASLTDAFGAEKTAFEAAHPGIRVTINSGASSMLANQIIGGAPVDVFAPADEATMTKVADAGLLATSPVTFATNTLQIIVRKANPQRIETVADLARSDVVYVTCATDVPIGRYASEVLGRAGVRATPRSLEADVRGIVAKVSAGEADAGIVYATDVTATKGSTTGVDIPAAQNVVVRYPIAVLAESPNRTAATMWTEFVLSPEGRAILARFGFGPP